MDIARISAVGLRTFLLKNEKKIAGKKDGFGELRLVFREVYKRWPGEE